MGFPFRPPRGCLNIAAIRPSHPCSNAPCAEQLVMVVSDDGAASEVWAIWGCLPDTDSTQVPLAKQGLTSVHCELAAIPDDSRRPKQNLRQGARLVVVESAQALVFDFTGDL